MSTRPLRPCATPSCGQLVPRGRCPEHSKERNARRGTTTERGYGRRWQIMRSLFAKRYPPIHCECCGEPAPKVKLLLDHDHTTNRRRGWLCTSCNTRMGLMEAGSLESCDLRAYLTLTATRG